MGRKPVQVLAGVALVGLLAAGCERNSTVGGFEGSTRVSQGPAGFNGRGTVATRNGTASIAAAGQTGTPMGSAAGSLQQQMPAGTAFPGNASTAMPVVTQQNGPAMPTVNQTVAYPSNSVMPAGTPMMSGAGSMSYSGAPMPAGQTMDDGAMRPMVGGVVPSQNAFGGAPQMPASAPQSTLAPSGGFSPSR